jgi:putative ABC transport system permease protein
MARTRLSHILFLYRARLRARTVLEQEGFAILGIAIGVALLFASQVASTSLTRSVFQLDRQIVGAQQLQIQARGPGGFDERLLGQVRRVPGVQDAFPVLEQQANVVGPSGQRSADLIGTEPNLSRIAGPLLRHFSANQLARQRAIILPAPIAQSIGAGPLQLIKLQIGGRTIEALLGVALGEAEIGELVNSPVAAAPLIYAQYLTGMNGKITRIFIRTLPEHEYEAKAALTKLAAAAGANLESADYDSQLFSVAVAPASKSEALFSGISALVGFLFALNAMLITVPSRRKLIEEIRPQGATRRMTVEILLFDAAVIGALACVLGLALGELLSLAVFRATPGYLSFAFPVGNDRIVAWQSVFLAIGAGLAAAVLGVLWPLRGILASRFQTEEESGDARRGWIVARLAIGFVCLAATTIILVGDTEAAVLGNITLVIALVCLLPFLFDGLLALFGYARRRLNGAVASLTVIGLRTPQTRVRSLAIAATAAVAVFGTIAFQGAQANLASGLDASARGIDSSADVWATASGESNAFATTPFKDTSSRALARLPGVASVGLYRGSFLDWEAQRLWVLAPPASTRQPIPVGQLVSGDPALAAMRIREGGWAVLSQALAAEHQLHVGQAFVLPSPRPMTLRVAGLSTNLGWPPGAIILNATDYARAWGSSDPSAYEIQTTPGASPAAVRSLVQHALGSETGLTVETSTEREHRHYALAAQSLSRLTQIRLLVIFAAILAVTFAIGSMLWQRRDLIAFLKVDGYRRSVLRRWLLCESAILLVAGCTIGAVFGLYAQLLISHALATVTGFPITFNVEVFAALSNFALVSVIAITVAALPGYLVVRVPASAASAAY